MVLKSTTIGWPITMVLKNAGVGRVFCSASLNASKIILYLLGVQESNRILTCSSSTVSLASSDLT